MKEAASKPVFPFTVSHVIFMMVLLSALLLLTAASPSFSANPGAVTQEKRVSLFFFWAEGCPHCAAAKPFLKMLEEKYPFLLIKSYEVLNDKNNLKLQEQMAKSRKVELTGIPMFFIGDKVFTGFNESISREIYAAVNSYDDKSRSAYTDADSVNIPYFGRMNPRSLSLPVFTIVIAGLDSFNPCAFFVLFTLLSLIVHAHSRKKMLLIGGIFVFFSGAVYFLFMAAWLNLFFIVGHLSAVTYAAAITALIISTINVKDYFLFKKGLSLTIPESSKPRLFERMRGLLHMDSMPAVLGGTVVLAVAANSYELLCTAGFPMVYTRMLTMNSLSTGGYYAYLALYNLIYVVPLAVIVSIFVITLGSRKMTEWQGRVLKLVSGLMMFSLAIVLLINPSLLQNPLISVILLLSVLAFSALLVILTKRILHR